MRDRYVIRHSASSDSKVNTVQVLLLMLNIPMDSQTQFPLTVRTVEVNDCRLVNGGWMLNDTVRRGACLGASGPLRGTYFH